MSPQRSVSSENLTNLGNSISYSHSAQSRAGRVVIKLLENATGQQLIKRAQIMIRRFLEENVSGS